MILNSKGNHLRNYIKSLVSTVLLLLVSLETVSAQKSREVPPPLSQRLFFGGNFGLQFGTITDIQVAPVIGIWLLPRLAVAVGPDYRYYKYQKEATAIYGGKSYIQFVVIKNLSSFLPIGSNTGVFLQIEDDLLSLESSFWKQPPVFSERFNVNTVLGGGGLSQQVGRRSSIDIAVLWTLNDPGYALYSTPEFRISFIF
jgi:hypothetical protein